MRIFGHSIGRQRGRTRPRCSYPTSVPRYSDYCSRTYESTTPISTAHDSVAAAVFLVDAATSTTRTERSGGPVGRSGCATLGGSTGDRHRAASPFRDVGRPRARVGAGRVLTGGTQCRRGIAAGDSTYW